MATDGILLPVIGTTLSEAMEVAQWQRQRYPGEDAVVEYRGPI
jgi:hypothetical protein